MSVTTVVTSASWRTLELSWFGGALNAEPAGWMDPGFDDTAWSAAIVPDPGSTPGTWSVLAGAAFITCDAYTDGHNRGLIWITRHEFTLAELPVHPTTLRWSADNYAQIWMNGVELVPAATDGLSLTGGRTVIIDPGALVVGVNVLAVKVTNESVTTTSTWAANPTMLQGIARISDAHAAAAFDVYRINAPGDTIEFLATLDDITNRSIRPVRNAPGSGQFTINKNSPHATAAILAPGNLVKVRYPAIHSDYIFAFFLDQGDFTLLSPDEEGGEEFTFGGAGALNYWNRAIWLSSGFVIPWWPDDMEDPPAGAIGLLRAVAQRMAFYDVGIVGGKEVITDQDFVTVGAYDAYYDRRKTLSWPVSEGGPGGFRRHLVHIMAGEPHDTRWVHPSQKGVTDIRASHAIGDTILLTDIGDGDKPGQVLERMYQEGISATRPAHPIPLMTIDFDDTLDSDGNAWTTTDALEGVTASLGESYIETIARLLALGVIDVEMGPDLDMHAYNSQGRDLTAGTFTAGKVRFVKGVNIADELRREMADQPVGTFVEVVGTDNAVGQAELPDAASRVAREVSLTGDTNTVDALEALGLANLQARLIRSDAIGFKIAAGDDETLGRYLPGPDYSDNGHFWLGDIIRLHTGSGDQDFDEEDLRVYAITISEDDAGNLDVTVEVGSVLGEDERRLYGIAPPSTGAAYAIASQFTDTEAAETSQFLDDLADVDTSAVADGDTILYDLASETWLAGSIASGGRPPWDYVIAADDSDPALQAIADAVCDGTADQTEINAAITAAVTADRPYSILLLPGTYNIAASVDFTGLVSMGGKWVVFEASGTTWIAAANLTTMVKLDPGAGGQIVTCADIRLGALDGNVGTNTVTQLVNLARFSDNILRIEDVRNSSGIGFKVSQSGVSDYPSGNNKIDIEIIHSVGGTAFMVTGGTNTFGFQGNTLHIGEIIDCDNGIVLGASVNQNATYNTFICGVIEYNTNAGIYDYCGGNTFFAGNLNSNDVHLGGPTSMTLRSTFRVHIDYSGGGTIGSPVLDQHYVQVNGQSVGRSFIGEKGSTPATPPSGYGEFYPKSDGLPYFLNDAGTETVLGGTGAPTGADYLVGTANGSLSAEIVVGTSPGGELGGTWASPTVDATHAGSTHIALSSATPLVESGAGSAGSGTAASKDDHVHPAAASSSTGGPILIEDTPAGSPLIFADLLQNEAGDDLLYADSW